jgi:16S rRNA (uracil1498-N3)-methyltransferase
MPRFYCPVSLKPGLQLELPEALARHAVGALRLRDGERVTLFNGQGGEYTGILRHSGKRAGVDIERHLDIERESPLTVGLVQGISSGERMDLTIQKSVELGVAAIQPVSMRRSVVRLSGDKLDKRRAHWQGVVNSACEQCGRNRPPEVAAIADFDAWLKSLPTGDGLRLLLDPEATHSLNDLPIPTKPILLLAGPEGGFDPDERRNALRQGFQGVRLGPRILRTETAALAALAAMQTLWGDFLK